MYYPNYQTYPQSYPQKHDVVKVNGRNGAEAFSMLPNSSVLLLDETQPLVWLKTTDGAGYPTLTPYTITPYEEKKVDVQSFEERLSRLERAFDESNNPKHDEPKRSANKKSNADG